MDFGMKLNNILMAHLPVQMFAQLEIALGQVEIM